MPEKFIINSENNLLTAGPQPIAWDLMPLLINHIAIWWGKRMTWETWCVCRRNAEVTVAEARPLKTNPESGLGVDFCKLSYSHNPNGIWEQ